MEVHYGRQTLINLYSIVGLAYRIDDRALLLRRLSISQEKYVQQLSVCSEYRAPSTGLDEALMYSTASKTREWR